jgi:biotin operon repressor
MRKNVWKKIEEKILIEKYATHTIKELVELIGRTDEAINNKIKRLKQEGKIKSEKDPDTVKRAYLQRD